MYHFNIFKAQNIANLKDTLQKMTHSLLVNVDIPIDTKRLKDSMESAKILSVWSPPPWCLVEVPPGQDAGRTPSFGRPLSIAVHREFVAPKDFGLGIATK